MPSHHITSAQHIIDLTRELGEHLPGPITVSYMVGFDRRAAQNRLMWKWAGEVEKQRPGETMGGIQREWKLIHGVPIAREDHQFTEFWYEHFEFTAYEYQLKAMRYIPVTSNFKTGEMARFLECVQRDCIENGFQITDPEAMGL